MKLHLPKALRASLVAAIALAAGYANAADKYVAPTQATPVFTWSGTNGSLNTPGNWTNAGGQTFTPGAENKLAATFKFDGSTVKSTVSLNLELLAGDNSAAGNNNTGYVVTNGADVTMTTSRWFAMLVVDSGSTLNLTMGSDSSLKTPAVAQDSVANVYVAGDLTINNMNMCLFGGWHSHDQNWFVGQDASITLSGANTWKGGDPNQDWNIQVQEAAELTGLSNRQYGEYQRTVISTTNNANITKANIVLTVLDAQGNTKTVDPSKITKDTTGLKVHCNGYEAADLVWGNGTGAWSNTGAGFHFAEQDTDTSFLNGDSVTFTSTAPDVQTVNVASTGVRANGMTVNGKYLFTGGAINAKSLSSTSGAEISVNNGSLYITSGVGTATDIAKWTTDANSTISISGDYNLDASTTINANMNIYGKLSLNRSAADVVIEGGKVNVGRIAIHDSAATAGNTDNLLIKGGVVNVSSEVQDAGTNAAVLIGHWPGGTNSLLKLTGGVLNADKGITHITWDSAGTLTVEGGEANLMGIKLHAEWSSLNATVNLSGGRLNIGSLGVKSGTASAGGNRVFNATSGTLGTLTSDEWEFGTNIKVGGDFTIDTSVREVSQDGASSAKKNGADDVAGSIKITGAIADSSTSTTGNITKTGLGTLTLAGNNSSYSGNITVAGGTLVAGSTNALGTGTVTVNNGATLAYNGDNTLSSNVTLQDGSKLAVDSGKLTLGSTRELAYGNISLANGAAIATGNDISLTADGVIYKNGATITASTDIKELSAWAGGYKVSGGELVINSGKSAGERTLALVLDGTSVTTKEASKFTSNATLSGLTTEKSTQFTGTANITGAATIGANTQFDANATLGGATTVNTGKIIANAQLKATNTVTLASGTSIEGKCVTIAAKTPDTPTGRVINYGDEDVSDTPTVAKGEVKNVTIDTTSLTGGTGGGSIKNADVTMKSGATSLSGVTFENSTLDITAAPDLVISDVVFGTGTSVNGTAKASGSNTFVLTETMVEDGTVDFKSFDDGVVVTYDGFGKLDFTGTTVLTLDITEGFLAALQKEVAPDSTNILTFVFKGSSGLEGTTLGATLAEGLGSWAAIDGTPTLVGDNGVKISFTPKTNIAVIPEPATGVLSMLALAALAARRRRKH